MSDIVTSDMQIVAGDPRVILGDMQVAGDPAVCRAESLVIGAQTADVSS